jgi:predicted transcriptional regulator
MSKKSERFFKWENYASVEDLADNFKKSKRRIQQVIQELSNSGLIQKGILVIDQGLMGLDVKPVYRRIGK